MTKGEVVSQSFPQVLQRGPTESNRRTQDSDEPPRVALANWLTDTEHGAGHLLARVIVNRVWAWHFVRGIVNTPSDFGSRGGRPSHPELLDWLATEFINSGWRLKSLHRLIMNSAVYMQSYREDAHASRIDPDNALMWRRNVNRLQAESIRDSILAVSGQLDRSMFGVGTLDATVPRRSIYLTVKRIRLVPILQLFDAPDALQSVGVRQTTTVAPQALLMLNNPWVRERAVGFVKRIDRGGKLDAVIRAGFLAALARPPSDSEQQSMREFVTRRMGAIETRTDARQQALADFCQMLMCLNEFIYVE